ncbi:MAG: GLPGLI family protein [Bacteroidales bacterium]|nr:GLPGLI family protein [Bacteroidales bacterium]
MKNLIFPIILCLVVIAANAQTKADIEVSYTMTSPNMRTGKLGDSTHQYILLANSSQSKFYSPRTEQIDSLCSTPDGEAKFKEMQRAAALAGNFDDIPRRDGSMYVVKSTDTNVMKVYDTAGMEQYVVEEPIENIDWTLSEDSLKNVLGYDCIMATADYHGRKWTAWFTPEIPLQAGPWKLAGLPGLILEADADNGVYSFVATGIQNTTRQISPVYLADRYEKVSRKDLLKAQRSFFDNPLGQINAKFGDKGVVVSGDVKFADASVVDLIESDYHDK